MKKILFISPSCYPIYGSEASCNIKFLYVLFYHNLSKN